MGQNAIPLPEAITATVPVDGHGTKNGQNATTAISNHWMGRRIDKTPYPFLKPLHYVPVGWNGRSNGQNRHYQPTFVSGGWTWAKQRTERHLAKLLYQLDGHVKKHRGRTPIPLFLKPLQILISLDGHGKKQRDRTP
ncbi:hypothetical protein AVEN_185987-1 [Araneus ventricosus]|uniref:Uncharacterized protein n=1 Tax=Araneus ventricosus TaxID=182803 RepID=A0A4Y2K6V8_ARAVE|nr:hypothetical protein AVEN_185987-1 [Araneus ventricosus]